MRKYMKNKILSILSVLLVASLLTLPVSAGPGIKFSASFSLGSLIAEGFATGLGNTDVTFVLNASGTAVITCTNTGGNAVPGQSAPKISATGKQTILGTDPRTKNGKTPFKTETDDPDTLLWDVAGCPSSNWTGRIDFIYWTDATIYLYQGSDPNNLGDLIGSQNYTCTTTRFPASVSCTRVP